jgi:membrane fusion protein, multidrug efflux system
MLLQLIIIFCLFASCHHKKAETKTISYPVQIGVAEAKDTPLFIEALGHVDSMTSIDVYSRIEGELTGVFFNQGEEVKKGDLLFTIDPLPYQAKLNEAQGMLEQAQANLSLSIEKVKRYRTLTQDEFYSQIDYETLQSTMAANQALVATHQAQVDAAKINLDYCWIYSPIDAMTGILKIDYGNFICAGCQNPLVTLNQMSPIFVTFSVPEFQLHRILQAKRKGELRVLASFEEFKPNDLFEGALYMIDNTVDPKTGMIKLRAVFENQTKDLWPGQFVRSRIILTTLKNAVVIPFSAVQITQTNPIVFVINPDMTVIQRTVKLGTRQDEMVVILEGIKAGEKIVVEGQMNLNTGTKVFVP